MYINAKTKITVICKVHGRFSITPNNHLNGQGCSKCGRLAAASRSRLTDTNFISRAKDVHGDIYDYRNVVYKNNSTVVEIICNVHGAYMQGPNNHLNGQGCPECAKHSRGMQCRKTLSTFLEEAYQVHNNLYDYTHVLYTGRNKKVCICCSEHGVFYQTPAKHLSGQGCPMCSPAYSKHVYNFLTPVTLYVIHLPEHSLWKVGITKYSIEERYRKDKIVFEVVDSLVFPIGALSFAAESAILRHYRDAKYIGHPVLPLGGNSELLTVRPDIKNTISMYWLDIVTTVAIRKYKKDIRDRINDTTIN